LHLELWLCGCRSELRMCGCRCELCGPGCSELRLCGSELRMHDLPGPHYQLPLHVVPLLLGSPRAQGLLLLQSWLWRLELRLLKQWLHGL
jgi:hypothetical protein